MKTILPTVLLLLAGLCACTPQPQPAATPATATLRLLSYNIHHGVGMDNRLDLLRQAAVIQAAKADWVGLQEVDNRCTRSGKVDQPAELQKQAGFSQSFFSKSIALQGGGYGPAALCGLPGAQWHTLDLPAGGREGRSVLFNVVQVLPDRRPLVLANVHLDSGDDDSVRLPQVKALLAELDRMKLPAVILGDFNDTPGSRTLEVLKAAGFQSIPKKGNPCTFNAPKPTQEIDHMLVRSGPGLVVEPQQADVIVEPVASDHRPLLGTVKVRATPE